MRRTGIRLLRWYSRPGQTAAELAIVVTVLLVLLFGIIEMGIVIYDYNMICSAAREAVRYAIVHSSDTTGIKNAAINSAPFLTASNITFTLVTDPNDSTQKDARVAVSYTYALNIPLLSSTTLTLTSTSQMLVSQ